MDGTALYEAVSILGADHKALIIIVITHTVPALTFFESEQKYSLFKLYD